MIEADRADHSRAKLDHDLIVPITSQTPLSMAASNGHEGVMRMLLRFNDVDPNTPDKYGRTPLSLAAWYGHEGVVRILLEQNGVNPD